MQSPARGNARPEIVTPGEAQMPAHGNGRSKIFTLRGVQTPAGGNPTTSSYKQEKNMIEIKDERDIQDALEQMNEYLERRGSTLYVTIVPRAFADALNEWYRNEHGESII